MCHLQSLDLTQINAECLNYPKCLLSAFSNMICVLRPLCGASGLLTIRKMSDFSVCKHKKCQKMTLQVL